MGLMESIKHTQRTSAQIGLQSYISSVGSRGVSTTGGSAGPGGDVVSCNTTEGSSLGAKRRQVSERKAVISLILVQIQFAPVQVAHKGDLYLDLF